MAFKEGHKPWNKGIKGKDSHAYGRIFSHSKDSKIKMSISSKKKWGDLDYRNKISKAHSHKLPKSWKENISNGKKGIIPKNFELMRKSKNAGFENANYKGENHWHWKGGISALNNSIRSSGEYNIWRNKVFKRDNFKCVGCSDKGYLNAHHIMEFSKYPEHRFTVTNGIALCNPCHSLVHGRKI